MGSGSAQTGRRSSWYGAAAKAGYTDALYNLDWLYLQGRAIHTDATEARSWYRSRNFR